MYKQAVKTITSLAIVLIMVLTLAVPAKAASAVAFSVENIEAGRGSVVTIPVCVDSTFVMNGFAVSIAYDTNALTYIEDSFASSYSKLDDAVVYANTRVEELAIVWESDEEVSVTGNRKLFSVQFRVNQSAASEEILTLQIGSLYQCEFDTQGKLTAMKDLQVASKSVEFKISTGTVQTSQAVQNVIDAIAAIGTVTATSECLSKINAAAQSYSYLTQSQKAQVTNYQELLDAQLEYTRLKNLEADSAVSQEIAGYLTKYKDTLTLTTETIQLSDKERVHKAQEDFNNLSADARYEIFHYKLHLTNLIEQLEFLQKAADDAKAAAEQAKKDKAQAQEYVEEFKKEYATMLALKEKDLLPGHKDGLTAALSQLNVLMSLPGVGPYVSEMLGAEAIMLQNYYDIVMAMQDEEGESDVQKQVDLFKITFAYLLELDETTATKDDEFDLLLALEVYKLQTPEVQAALQAEYETLNKLYDYVSALPDTEEEIVVSVGSNVNGINVSFSQRKIGIFILYLMAIFVVSAVTFTGLQIFYRVKGGKIGEKHKKTKKHE